MAYIQKLPVEGPFLIIFLERSDSVWILYKNGITTKTVSVGRIEELTLRNKIINIGGASITNI